MCISGYVAKDAKGNISLFTAKPTKDEKMQIWIGGICRKLTEQDLTEGLNPQWEDSEPIEIELKIKRKNE